MSLEDGKNGYHGVITPRNGGVTMRIFLGLLLTIVIAIALGCGDDDDDGAAGSGGTGGTTADAGSEAGTGGTGAVGGGGSAEGGGAEMASVNFIIVRIDEEGKTVPAEGVRICETDTTNCNLTDEDGIAAIQVPANEEVSYTQEKEGHSSHLRADVVPPSGTEVFPRLITDAQKKEQFDRLESPYPMEGTGEIRVQVRSDPIGLIGIEGATLRLVNGSGKLFYLDDDRSCRLDLTATASPGAGGFVEVAPGEYEIEIGGTAKNCEVVRGWPSDSANTIRVLVLEGFTTISRVDCDDVP